MRNINSKNGKEIFEGFIVDNITIKDIEFDEEKFNNLIVDELTREDLFNIVLAYRKQLKVKEQECEELKETIQLQNKMQMEVCEEKDTELDQLKKENEELKEKYELLLDNFLSNFYTGLDEKYDKLEQQLDKLKAENEELKKQLESTKGLVTVENKQLAEVLKVYEELTSECSQQKEETKDLTNKMTFFQKIKSMNIDELAEFFESYTAEIIKKTRFNILAKNPTIKDIKKALLEKY